MIDLNRYAIYLVTDILFAQVVNHPSKVIEIQMKKAGFHHEAGQVYIVFIA